MPEAVIVSAIRTPIGRAHKGSLVDVRPEDLAVTAIDAALDQVPELDRRSVEDLLLGCTNPQRGDGANIARRVTVQLGLDHLPGATMNRFCSSSVQTTQIAFHA